MIKIEMTNKEAILRLKDHFAIHDDGRPTPHLDEAKRMAIEALKIADRLEHAYHNAFGIDLAKCTKYGNKSAEQQRDSYSTVMMYEVANVFDDILGE